MHSPASRLRLWSLALQQPSVWKRAATLGLSAGGLQAILNQGDHWISGHVTAGVLAKTILCPLVGLGVALAAAAGTWVEKQADPLSKS